MEKLDDTITLTEINENSYSINMNDLSYLLDIFIRDKSFSIKIKRQLPFSLYEGIFTHEDMITMPFFKNYNSFDSMLAKLREKLELSQFKMIWLRVVQSLLK
jgi:hypothetical protein